MIAAGIPKIKKEKITIRVKRTISGTTTIVTIVGAAETIVGVPIGPYKKIGVQAATISILPEPWILTYA